MMRVGLMLVFFICCSTGGEIAMTHGMKQVGEPESFRPMALLRFVGKAMQKQLGVVCGAVAGRVILFAAYFAVVGAAQRGDPRFGVQLRCGHVWGEISAERAGVREAMDGRGDGVCGCDPGVADGQELTARTCGPYTRKYYGLRLVRTYLLPDSASS